MNGFTSRIRYDGLNTSVPYSGRLLLLKDGGQIDVMFTL